MQAPIRSQLPEKNGSELLRCMGEWGHFVEDVRAFYDVDLACLAPAYEAEQREYLQQTAAWSDVHPGNMLGKIAVLKEYDLRTISLEEARGPIKCKFDMLVTRPGPVQGFVGFFDAFFEGSPQCPADHKARSRHALKADSRPLACISAHLTFQIVDSTVL